MVTAAAQRGNGKTGSDHKQAADGGTFFFSWVPQFLQNRRKRTFKSSFLQLPALELRAQSTAISPSRFVMPLLTKSCSSLLIVLVWFGFV